MPGPPSRSPRHVRRVALAALCLAALPPPARADLITLRGGNSIRGKVLPDRAKPDAVSVIMESGSTPLTFRKEQVVSVVPEAGVLDEYLPRRLEAASNPSARAEHQLGIWCEENKLADLARVHLQAALKLDPDLEDAHRRLGHTLVGDRWLDRDELRRAQGLVKYRGRWITLEEKERHESDQKLSAQQISWTRRLKILRAAILEGEEPRRTEAEQQLRGIRDPQAVRPLVRAFGLDGPSIRALLVRVLAEIPGPQAASALADRLLGEDDADVRQSAMEELARRNDGGTVDRLASALRSRDVRVVNRAAWALGNLKAPSAFRRLVDALTTTEQNLVWMPTETMPSPGGVGVLGAVAPPPASVGGFQGGLSGGGSYALLTPPAMAPGAVAFGAQALPLAPTASIGVSTTMGAGRGPYPVMVPYVHRNTEVRAALVKLTGQDFGYDAEAWRRWAASSFRPEPRPARQVPQP